MKLTDDQLHTLRHMLGINTPDDRIPKPYRNYAAVNPGDPIFIELKKVGAVRKYEVRTPTQYHWYECTEAGRLAAIRSHGDIRKTKAQRKYSIFLDMTDIFPDITFKDFLTHKDFAEIRNNA